MKGDRFLTKPCQYEKVYSQGSSRASRMVIMKVMPNGLEYSRYGISVSHRVGNAVVRNRTKRRLREILRSTAVKPGWDMVFIARPLAANSKFSVLEKNIEFMLKKE
jgi:ribonuclease P protein component